jgi:hypothetical protein
VAHLPPSFDVNRTVIGVRVVAVDLVADVYEQLQRCRAVRLCTARAVDAVLVNQHVRAVRGGHDAELKTLHPHVRTLHERWMKL